MAQVSRARQLLESVGNGAGAYDAPPAAAHAYGAHAAAYPSSSAKAGRANGAPLAGLLAAADDLT